MAFYVFPRVARFGRVLWLCGLGLIALPHAGCDKVSSDNIALWKTTEKGPGKLVAALQDRGVDPKLRAEAATALIEIGKADEVDASLAAMPANQRWDLGKALVPVFEAGMKDSSSSNSLAYRDALFSLRELSGSDEKAQIDAVLIPSVIDELRTGKVRNGRHSVEKILTATGSSSGNLLAGLLADPIPGYASVADLLARVGDEGAREKGGAALVKRAAAQHPIPDPMWKSLGVVGGPSAVAFLQARIQGGGKDEALPAVRALQQRRDPSLLPYALRIAGDQKADPGLRDEMFGVVETIGGPQAKAGLAHIIQADPKEMVRYRAFESLLTVAKQDGIIPGLEAFPATATYKRVDVDDLLVKLCEKLGAPARPVLVAALQSKAPLARMTAVMTLEQIGKSSDAAALENIGKDTTMIKGFPGGDTIGKAALRVAGIVRGKN